MAARAKRAAEVRAEHLLTEMLEAQGWDTRRPPAGDFLRQHEYREHSQLLSIFRGKSKSDKGGDGMPEGILVDRAELVPLVVIEAKAERSDLAKAEQEVKIYGRACLDAGYTPLLVALAGTSGDDFAVRVLKWTGTAWKPVTYDGDPITWIPNRVDVDRLITPSSPFELRPSIPPPDVLAARADEINGLLRQSGIKDEYRPAVVAAIMLGLAKSNGNIRKDPNYILQDINQSCAKAFWAADKPRLQESLRVDEANEALAKNARRIVTILERLNVHVLTAEHDYLGQLYETFFRYTGGNTIGQYFTPRHVAAMMADMTDVTGNDVVIDPACGTGGFLIAAMNRIMRTDKLSRAQLVKIVGKRLIGIDKEPVTAALCVANMILRGDGTTGVHQADSLTWKDYPVGKATVALLNPPFPHRNTDTPPERFVERALEALQVRGRLAVLVPTSVLVKKEKAEWRNWLRSKHTINGIISFERELWHPYADSVTSILLLTKGVPHRADRPVFFAKVKNDGYRVIKQVKMPVPGSQLDDVLRGYQRHETIPGLCGWAALEDPWGPGLYVPARKLSDEEIIDEVYYLARSRSSAVVSNAHRLVEMQDAIATGAIKIRSVATLKRLQPAKVTGDTIGGSFQIVYGQKDLHNKRDLVPGLAIAISSQGTNNGWYGFFDIPTALDPPFVTVPSTGSIAQAHVQEWPCGVADDCLILVPKTGVSIETLYIAAAVVRYERWRFNYGMKATPDRIAGLPLPDSESLIARVRSILDGSKRIDDAALEAADDERDARIASERLREIDSDAAAVVSGDVLMRRLTELRD